jgi:hypothetical protein
LHRVRPRARHRLSVGPSRLPRKSTRLGRDRLDVILTPDRVEVTQALLDRLPVLFAAERTLALSALADESRRLTDALEAGELPASHELRQIPRDIHAMLELIDDLHQVVTGVPGAGIARDHGADEHAEVSTKESPPSRSVPDS